MTFVSLADRMFLSYLQLPWIVGDGPAKALGAQCGITAAAALIVVFLQIFGKRIRQWQEGVTVKA
jgi:hypothetical protein